MLGMGLPPINPAQQEGAEWWIATAFVLLVAVFVSIVAIVGFHRSRRASTVHPFVPKERKAA